LNYRVFILCAIVCSLLSCVGTALAQRGGTCGNDAATQHFRAGFAFAETRQARSAISKFQACLEADPNCVPCLYEIGWVYWTQSEWDNVIKNWEQVLQHDPHHVLVTTWLGPARDHANNRKTPGLDPTRVPIAIRSTPEESPVQMELVARFQSYNANPKDKDKDHYDQDIFSPKSARYSADGKKVYVNSLEGYRTVVYDAQSLTKRGVINHHFTAKDTSLFQEQEAPFSYRFNRRPPSGKTNHFRGKPVESELSHNGKFLWIPYYRRDFDVGATSPSAVAIIDTQTDQIVRVMPTGPIPKYVEASPDGQWVAVTHWGDNTVALIDTSTGNPGEFTYRSELLVVEVQLSQKGLSGEDRDKACGYCLRGTVFTPDSKTLLVSRMSGGGIAGFDVESGRYLGTVQGMRPTPRHLVIDGKGESLFLSSNASGYVSKVSLERLVESLQAADGELVALSEFEATFVGSGARTISLGPAGRYIFAAVHMGSEVVVIDSHTMKVVSRIRTDSFTVGLTVSPDGSQVWTTSQARGEEGGGNSVCVYQVTYPVSPAAE
jgi:DNA-binding beta-propeller fold protein YncE